MGTASTMGWLGNMLGLGSTKSTKTDGAGKTNPLSNGTAPQSDEENDPDEQMVPLPAAMGHGKGCGHCVPGSMMGGMVKAKDFEKVKQAAMQDRISKVWAHEMAHYNAAGRMAAGGPTVNVGSDGNVSGH